MGRITGIMIKDETMYKCYFRIQPIRTFNDLPNTIKSKRQNQKSKDNNKLWLEESRIIIRIQDIVCYTNIWIKDDNLPGPSFFEFSIQEIIYILNGYQKIRLVSLWHKLPAEYCINIPKSSSNPNIKHFKIFVDLYYDDFGAFNKAYHKLKRIYIQLGNMNRELRRKLRNYFLIRFVPFGRESDDVLREFISDIKDLQNGILMEMRDEQV